MAPLGSKFQLWSSDVPFHPPVVLRSQRVQMAHSGGDDKRQHRPDELKRPLENMRNPPRTPAVHFTSRGDLSYIAALPSFVEDAATIERWLPCFEVQQPSRVNTHYCSLPFTHAIKRTAASRSEAWGWPGYFEGQQARLQLTLRKRDQQNNPVFRPSRQVRTPPPVVFREMLNQYII